jgi:GNAT superfamily N-acetyltransferase
MGLTPIARGMLATIVTSLEMIAKPKPSPLPSAPLRLARWELAAPDKYRTLYKRVGAPWLWFSRLEMDDEALTGIIQNPHVKLWAVTDAQGIEVGILELDFRTSGACEIAFLGLIPELAGKGFGRWMMGHALAAAWAPGIERVWLHTCTFDHPSALSFYRRSGFSPYATAIEQFSDPRLSGLLPREAAPQIPLLE